MERQVAKPMEEDMGSAMQYLQGKGLCLMPISLAPAISITTCHSRNPMVAAAASPPPTSTMTATLTHSDLIPTEESRFNTVAYVQRIWWLKGFSTKEGLMGLTPFPEANHRNVVTCCLETLATVIAVEDNALTTISLLESSVLLLIETISRQDLITALTGSRFQPVDCLSGPFADSLSRSNISFVRLDGTLNQQQREKVIKQFSEESNILVLLMSLKAGGVGINLMAASNAFVLDPWWNPAVEEQAVMRIHRIGQTKRVMIKRFIVKGTIQRSALIASKMQSGAT
ncbi:hypothetical protein AAG906_011638 [Vitis piasezkii]